MHGSTRWGAQQRRRASELGAACDALIAWAATSSTERAAQGDEQRVRHTEQQRSLRRRVSAVG